MNYNKLSYDNKSNLALSNRKLKSNTLLLLTCFIIFNFLSVPNLPSQMPASHSNWLYPHGNMQGTLYNPWSSEIWQAIDRFTIKWSTPAISGDVQPLIGNIIDNKKLMGSFRYAPNEIVAVVGGKLIVVDARGKVWGNTQLPPFIQNVSVLFDSTLATVTNNVNNLVVMGLETIVYENMRDSLAFAYIAGFNQPADSVALLKRLAIDLRPYSPNISASIKPFFGKREQNNMVVYTTVNMVSPLVPSTPSFIPPYYRGIAVFKAAFASGSYPTPDYGDLLESRMHLAPNISMDQPSILSFSGKLGSLLPVYPSATNSYDIQDPIFGITTYSDKPYLIAPEISSSEIYYDVSPYDLSADIPVDAKRPYIRPYYVELYDLSAGTGVEGAYILLSEGYMGIDSSRGTARLHLMLSDGNFLTYADDPLSPSYKGGKNHLWSVAVGNVDGNSSNQWLPYYPNNPGKEIIVTQSSREFAVAGSKLSVLRYNTDFVPKTSPPNTYLFPFDTICTQTINGWVAAVNDIDLEKDEKDEIFLVDGSTLRVLKMRNYDDFLFKTGRPFDTLFTISFKNETISAVAIADIEGDGLNDIIVTTYDSTYVIGSLITNILEVINPVVESSPPEEYCVGDTIKIKWVNKMRGQNYVNILYYEYLNKSRTGRVIPIDSNVVNTKDTVEYFYIVDNEVIGTDGRFIVESAQYPYDINDSTAILRLNNPILVVDSLATKTYFPGDLVHFTGRVACVDSVRIEYGLESSTWTKVWSEPINFDWTYDISAEIPCMDFFDCLEPDRDSILNARIIAYKEQWADTSNIFNLRIIPKPFPIHYDSCLTNCPTITFRWDKTQINFPCDTVIVSVSTSGSGTFSYLDKVARDKEEYVWLVPLNMPDSIFVRFCCEASCVRTDTIIKHYKPSFIDIIAPNPFNPTREQMEITYQVPSATNVTIKILDQANRLVANIITSQQRQPNIAYCDRWNGLIWDGSLAQNGMYYLCLEMSNGIKEVFPVFVRK